MNSCTPTDPNFTGARMAVYPMHDGFVDTVLKAVGDTNPKDLYVAVDDLGTTVQGTPERVFAYAEELFVRAAAAADHVTAVMQFSAGGKPVATTPQAAIDAVPLPDASFPVAANWTLYPLGVSEYSDLLIEAIEKAVHDAAVESSVSCYASRLDGTAAAIFQTLKSAFTAVRAQVPHTVIHVTLSKGSPSVPKKQIDVYGGETS